VNVDSVGVILLGKELLVRVIMPLKASTHALVIMIQTLSLYSVNKINKMDEQNSLNIAVYKVTSKESVDK